MMESIEKLCEFVDDQFVSSGQAYLQGLAIAGSIEREIAEKYMERPCDMDGVPVKIGDELSHDGFARNFIVHSYELTDGAWSVWDVANGATHLCQACRHVKPDPLKELLHDACMNATRICCEHGVGTNVHVEIDETGLAEYAERIRELMEVGE